MNKTWTVTKESVRYKCGWSPFEGVDFRSHVDMTIVNGNIAWDGNDVSSLASGERMYCELMR